MKQLPAIKIYSLNPPSENLLQNPLLGFKDLLEVRKRLKTGPVLKADLNSFQFFSKLPHFKGFELLGVIFNLSEAQGHFLLYFLLEDRLEGVDEEVESFGLVGAELSRVANLSSDR